MILVTRYFFSVRSPFFRHQREGSESYNEQGDERIFHVARTACLSPLMEAVSFSTLFHVARREISKEDEGVNFERMC